MRPVGILREAFIARSDGTPLRTCQELVLGTLVWEDRKWILFDRHVGAKILLLLPL